MSGIKRLNVDWTWQEMDPHPDGALVYFDDHEAEIARLRAEADALRKDAERYRYLRTQEGEFCITHGVRSAAHGAAIDAAIDAAMGADE